MKMRGQRWRYRIGNHLVDVDNGFAWIGWAQERMVVNGEPLHRTGAWFSFRRSFKEPWLTPIGDDELSIDMRSTLTGIVCNATIADEQVEPEALYETAWSGGKGSWPEDEQWIETKQFSFFKF
ncbi:hypothetical protein A9995_08925 [Erythrobacter sp. QSSC1-22B]|nr:hypothetical protein A9995_08925 [Erythrobacter sp. QSSC1-22B]